jgi:TolB-like protein/Tfp pilus assembly protein PilF
VPIEHIERCLAAILAADVAGYSRLTGLDEEGTHAQLQDHLRSLVNPKIAEHRGRVVKNTGDGLLAKFSSVVDAVRCAVEVQRGMAERNAAVPQERRIEFRIGINVGDVMLDGGDIFGDGVNVAVRLEGFAEAGGICIAGRVLEDIQGKLDVVFENAGEQRLKNIIRPVRVYRVRPSAGAAAQRSALPLPDKPSIAVLPFQNMSGDPEQEYFADGVVEEIITALSRFHELFVIARNSSFTYKGRAVDVKQVERELGVRYVLEGSVRKAANRIRIAAQLIDASTGAHLWADRFDCALEDIFDLQDHVSASVVGAIAPKLQHEEIKRARRKPIENLDAYDYYLRGLAKNYWTKDATSEALQLFCKAIEIDPDLASAYGMAAWCYARRRANGWMIDRAKESAEATRLARTAAHLAADDSVALCMGGYALARVAHEFEDAAAFMDRGLTVNPNFAQAWMLSAWLRVWRGEPNLALEHVAHAMRLSPLDPSMYGIHGAMAYAHFLASRYDMASSYAEKSMRDNPKFLLAICISAASNALAGQLEPAQKAMERALECSPDLRASNLRDLASFRRAEDLAMFAKGLRKARLPE